MPDEKSNAPDAPAELANPSIITFAPPDGQTTTEFVERCRSWGYQIAGQSGYLAERRLVQIAVMGAVTASDVEPLLNRLVHFLPIRLARRPPQQARQTKDAEAHQPTPQPTNGNKLKAFHGHPFPPWFESVLVMPQRRAGAMS